MATKALAIIAGVGPGTVRLYHLKLPKTNISIVLLIHKQGASIARRFATKYSVVVLARNPANFEPLVQEINGAGGQALGISTDLSDTTSIKSAFAQISKQYAGVPLAAAVFNPSGGFVRKPFLDLTEEEFSQGLDNQG